MPKYKTINSGYVIEIRDNQLVLDIGSGHNPHPRANVLLDKYPEYSVHREDKPLKINKEMKFVKGDAESIPFGNKKFDYVIASHIAEHVDNPENFCKELMRVGNEGYIETPSKLKEILFNAPYHKWYVYTHNGVLIFEKKTKQSYIGLFKKLFFTNINAESIKKRSMNEKIKPPTFLNKCSLLITLKTITLLMTILNLTGKTYTHFEWKKSFEFKIIQK